MAHVHRLDDDILQALDTMGACPIEQLMARLPAYSWNQVFGAVDRLSRGSRVLLSHPGRFDYSVAIHPLERTRRVSEVGGR